MPLREETTQSYEVPHMDSTPMPGTGGRSAAVPNVTLGACLVAQGSFRWGQP